MHTNNMDNKKKTVSSSSENTSSKKSNQVLDAIEMLRNGVDYYIHSGSYKEILNNLSKFHNYSLNNSILIGLQKPNVTYCASFETWKRKFNRSINKGEKGIKIIVPINSILMQEIEVKDDRTGLPVLDENGKVKTELKEIPQTNFKIGHVFDYSQTHQIEGKPVVDIELTKELKGDIKDYDDLIEALRSSTNAAVLFEDFDGPAKGYYDRNDNEIVVKKSMDEIQKFKTLAHETAHSILHNDSKNNFTKEDREVQAESVAYIVCNYYGINTSEYSFPYIGSWGKDSKRIDANLNEIKRASDEIISKTDEYLAYLKSLKQEENLQEKEASKADKTIKFYPEKEIEKLLKTDERLVFIDDGNDEVVTRYKDLADAIYLIDELENHNCNLRVYDFKQPNLQHPLCTTIGCYLDKCDENVREDIVNKLNKLQTGEEKVKNIKFINEDDLDIVEHRLTSDFESFNETTIEFKDNTFLYIQRSDSQQAYDYTLYKYSKVNQEYKEIDGGQLDNHYLNIDEAIKEISSLQNIKLKIINRYDNENYLENLESFKEENELDILDLSEKIAKFFEENDPKLTQKNLYVGQHYDTIFSNIRRDNGQETIKNLNDFIKESNDDSLKIQAKSLVNEINYFEKNNKKTHQLEHKVSLKMK